MKKALLSLALVAIAAFANAQGTIQFANNAGTRFTVDNVRPANTSVGGPAANTFLFAVFVGQTADSLSALPAGPLGGNTTTGGLITAPSPNAYQLAGTEANSTVYIQIRGWSASLGQDGWIKGRAGQLTGTEAYGETLVKQITLGPTAGPGTVIWGTAANQFGSMDLRTIPEPSTIAFGILGLGSLLLFRRRK